MSRLAAKRLSLSAPVPAQSPNARSTDLRGRIIGIVVILIIFTLFAWVFALMVSHVYPVLLGTAVVAYTLGLRHAVDADHLAAIDNATRKLMQDGQKPITVGLFFSLGHSSVVVLATVVIAFAASALESHLQSAKAIGGLIGTSVSAAFLFAIAFANVLILMGVFRAFQRVKNGESVFEEELDIMLANFGILRRVFKPIFGVIRSSWHLFPIGFLFGLGFDTATEIGVLGISAAGAAEGLPIWSILVFPALFTAAMTLIDTINNILVMGAYDWAFAKPIRKLYYNMIITFVSVVVAFTVGGIEVLGVIGNKLGLDQGFWAIIAKLNANFGALGYLIIVIFVMVWLLSVLVYVAKGYDRIEVTRA